eukprot:jgi/Tetstr1/447293/TSEL_034730.t1
MAILATVLLKARKRQERKDDKTRKRVYETGLAGDDAKNTGGGSGGSGGSGGGTADGEGDDGNTDGVGDDAATDGGGGDNANTDGGGGDNANTDGGGGDNANTDGGGGDDAATDGGGGDNANTDGGGGDNANTDGGGGDDAATDGGGGDNANTDGGGGDNANTDGGGGGGTADGGGDIGGGGGTADGGGGTMYAGTVYTGNELRAVIEPLHGIPVRQNTQKTCNIKIRGGSAFDAAGKTLVMDAFGFEIPVKVDVELDDDDGYYYTTFNGWQHDQAMANTPLKQSSIWEDTVFDGSLPVVSQDDYVHAFNLGRITVRDETVGSLTIAWTQTGTPVRVGKAYIVNSSDFEDSANAQDLIVKRAEFMGTTFTGEIKMTILVDGREYDTFSVAESETEFLATFVQNNPGLNYGVLQQHYRASHDLMAKGGNLLDVLLPSDSSAEPVLNVRIVYHQFSLDIDKILIGRALGESGLDDSETSGVADEEIDLFHYIITVLEINGITPSSDNIHDLISGSIELGLIYDMDSGEVVNATTTLRNLLGVDSGGWIPRLIYHAVFYLVDGFELDYVTTEASGSTEDVYNDLLESFNYLLTDDFVEYVKVLFESSCKNWTGKDTNVNIVGIHAHETHDLGRLQRTAATFSRHSSLQKTTNCSWSSTRNLVFRDMFTFPMFSPNDPAVLEGRGCGTTENPIWHVALHIKAMPTSAAAHVSDIFYSDTQILYEYGMYIQNSILLDRILTHEIGHTFGYHDVYDYPETARHVQVSADETIMYSADDATPTDRALFQLTASLRGRANSLESS